MDRPIRNHARCFRSVRRSSSASSFRHKRPARQVSSPQSRGYRLCARCTQDACLRIPIHSSQKLQHTPYQQRSPAAFTLGSQTTAVSPQPCSRWFVSPSVRGGWSAPLTLVQELINPLPHAHAVRLSNPTAKPRTRLQHCVCVIRDAPPEHEVAPPAGGYPRVRPRRHRPSSPRRDRALCRLLRLPHPPTPVAAIPTASSSF